jgi:hypothetical protein
VAAVRVRLEQGWVFIVTRALLVFWADPHERGQSYRPKRCARIVLANESPDRRETVVSSSE